MNRHDYYTGPDWWARLVSLGALIAAGGALYYSYTQSQRTYPLEDQRADFSASIDNWNRQAGDEIAKIRDAAEGELEAIYARLENGQVGLASHSEPPANAGPLHGSDPPQGSVPPGDTVASNDTNAAPSNELDAGGADAVNTGPPQSTAPNADLFAGNADPTLGTNPADPTDSSAGGGPQLPMGPKLLVARRALRTERGQLSRAIIVNSGQSAARIDEAYFVPQREVEVPENVRESSDVDADRVVRISFGRDDNSSTKPGAHGAYRQELAEPVQLAPGDEIEVDVEILNSDHDGWGLMGQLTLVAGSETVELNDATAVFRGQND